MEVRVNNMHNKILVVLEVPSIEKKYNVFLPINKKVSNIILLLTKAVSELTSGGYISRGNEGLYNKMSGIQYDRDVYLKDSDLTNGSTVILI